MDEYKQQFFSEEEGASRAAVKRLSRTIETELVEATINAPDWFVHLDRPTSSLLTRMHAQGHPLRRKNGQGSFVGRREVDQPGRLRGRFADVSGHPTHPNALVSICLPQTRGPLHKHGYRAELQEHPPPPSVLLLSAPVVPLDE